MLFFRVQDIILCLPIFSVYLDFFPSFLLFFYLLFGLFGQLLLRLRAGASFPANLRDSLAEVLDFTPAKLISNDNNNNNSTHLKLIQTQKYTEKIRIRAKINNQRNKIIAALPEKMFYSKRDWLYLLYLLLFFKRFNYYYFFSDFICFLFKLRFCFLFFTYIYFSFQFTLVFSIFVVFSLIFPDVFFKL